MKVELQLVEEFGPRLADGYKAADFRTGRVDPYVDICEGITLDFTGVRTANSSFVNALVAGAIEQHGARVLDVLSFKGCSPSIRVLVESAICIGLQNINGKTSA